MITVPKMEFMTKTLSDISVGLVAVFAWLQLDISVSLFAANLAGISLNK